MKWLYLPAIFVLAFFYAKINFNNFMPNRQNWPDGRVPASTEASCREMLASFYPSQSTEFLKQRLKNNSDFYSFFRAFAPVFYKEMLDQKFSELLKPLEKYSGTIGGDLHIENFGFAIDDKGKVFFVINDIDDSTEGKFSYDIIRHFISAKIVDKRITWDKYFDAYRKGLKKEPHAYSFYVEKGIDEAITTSDEYIDKYVSAEAPFKFIKFKNPYHVTTATEATELLHSLKKKFPKIEIFDQYVRVKEDGGSAGLKRFQVLARINPKDKVQWMDIKEAAISSYDKVFGRKEQYNFERRMDAIKDNIYDGRLNDSIGVLTIGAHPYTFRFVDQFASGIKLSDIPEDDYADLILDEAYAIGKMHSSSLKENAPEYAKAWSEIRSDAIEEKSIELKYKLKDLYKESKKDQ